MSALRIALAQIDVVVGDIAGNADLIVDSARAALAQGAELLLVPELALTGYPPEDLLAKDHFVEDARDALSRVAAACRGLVAVVGFVEREGEALYNAAAICRDGSVAQVYRKRLLPNYGVFDEERYFEAGAEPGLFEVDGMSVACTVCEDVWVPARR
jgi:NAD+ synthase (glutamine-hydrolysing)